MTIIAVTEEVRFTYLSRSMTELFYRYKLINNSWQGLLSLNGTLEEWAMKSDAEIAAIEAGIREVRELLDDK